MNRGGERHRRDQSNGRESGPRSDGRSLYRPLPEPSKETFLLLERHRPASAIDLSPRGLRPSRRYENLMLAAAVGQMQRDCLVSTPDCEWTARGGRRALLQDVGMSLERLAIMLERSAERLSHQQRVRAQARARRRFEEICLQVVEQGLRPEASPADPTAEVRVDPLPIDHKPAIAATAIPSLVLAGSSKALARLRANAPEGRMQTRVNCRGLHGTRARRRAHGLALRRLARRREREFPGIGVGGVSAAQGASSHGAQLEAFRPAHHSPADSRNAGRHSQMAPGATPMPRRRGRGARRAAPVRVGVATTPSTASMSRGRAPAEAARPPGAGQARRRRAPVRARLRPPTPPAWSTRR